MRTLVEKPLFHIALLLLLAILCYVPGLNSLFLFDDGPNLEALSQIQESSVTSAGFWEFVFSGEAGPTGRPVSLFTFALQASAWSDNPFAFKLANLFIHVLSSVLLYGISYKLSLHMQATTRRASVVALATALIWTLHPIHTSTVLYAVQRMALLSNLFMLAGLYSFVCYRLEQNTENLKSLAWLSLALASTGLLALFSKENAPSLVFYLLTLEFTLFKNLPASRTYRQWRLVFLYLPAIALILLPLFSVGALQENYEEFRTFTMGERVLTQLRILWTYLAAIILPATGSVGIFHDTVISTSLLSPITTLLALIAWIALGLGLALKPGKYGAWLFALCWFWSGHIIESTVVPLELFFHHRNYLAFFGIVFVLLFAFFNWLPDTLVKFRGRLAITGIYLLLLALNTFRISTMWSEPVRLAENWYEADPNTARNVEFYAMELARYGSDGEQLAAAVLSRAVENDPSNFHLLLNLLTLACVNPAIPALDPGSILDRARNLSRETGDPVSPVRQIINLNLQGNCPTYNQAFLESLLETLIQESQGHDRGMFQFELARLKLSEGLTGEALPLMEQAWENSWDSGVLFNMAIQLVNAGRFQEALETIDLATREVTINNNIRTGTLASKLASLSSMREDVIGFIASE